MMKSFITATALLLVIHAGAQTAEEIVAKHITAIGGADKIAALKTLYIESTTMVMGSNSLSKTYFIRGSAYRSETDFNGQNIIQVVTDKGGWVINPYGGSTTAAALSTEEFNGAADQVFTPDPLVNYAANGAKLVLEGQENIEGVNAYKLKYTNKYNVDFTYYIDPATWYIIRIVKQGMMMNQPVTTNITYSNYKMTDAGIMMAYGTVIDMGQFVLEITANKIEANKDIDPKLFDMPAK